jgi:hypothetical protein
MVLLALLFGSTGFTSFGMHSTRSHSVCCCYHRRHRWVSEPELRPRIDQIALPGWICAAGGVLLGNAQVIDLYSAHHASLEL